jgi:mono/diheme cytochrome c family protein
MRQLKFLLLALLSSFPFIVSVSGAAEEDYQRCAACHLPTGEGVPGAFPPLKGRMAALASSQEGRAYLVAVVNVGLMGSITVDGIPYMGVMPAQGSAYDAQGISRVLNYSVQVIDAQNVSANWKPFSTEEVEALLKTGEASSGSQSLSIRKSLLAKYPELQ